MKNDGEHPCPFIRAVSKTGRRVPWRLSITERKDYFGARSHLKRFHYENPSNLEIY